MTGYMTAQMVPMGAAMADGAYPAVAPQDHYLSQYPDASYQPYAFATEYVPAAATPQAVSLTQLAHTMPIMATQPMMMPQHHHHPHHQPQAQYYNPYASDMSPRGRYSQASSFNSGSLTL
jgi:hypothetical protein